MLKQEVCLLIMCVLNLHVTHTICHFVLVIDLFFTHQCLKRNTHTHML